MADSFIQLSPDSTGKRVDTRTAPDGDHREVNVIGSPTTADVAEADATNGLDVDVTRVIPGTSATHLGKAVDSVPGATDTGVAALVVRDDALGALTPADGDYTHLRTDSTGALWVRDTGGAAGGTAMADDAVFTPAVTNGTPAFGFADETAPDSVDEGDAGALRMTLDRKLLTRVVGATDANRLDVDGSGHAQIDIAAASVTVPVSLAAGGTTQYAEDSAHSSGDLVTLAGVVQQTADAALSSDGDRSVLQVDATGFAKVNVKSSALPSGASTLAEQQTQTTHLATIAGDTTDIETAVELIDDTVATLGTSTYTEATTKGLVVGAVRRDADTTLVDTTNEVAPLQVDANGRLKVEAFSGETLPVSLAAGGTTQYAEDTAHSSGDLVTMAGVVQQSADAALSSDGDRSVLQVDATGFAKVNVKASALPTGAATLAEQQTQTTHLATIAGDTTAIETAVQIMDDWDESDRAKVNPIAGQAGVQGASGTVTALTQRVVLATDVGLPAGSSNIGDVDVLTMPVTEVVGDVAADAAVPANPLAIGGRASTAVPAAVSADGDSVYAWLNRNGLTLVSGIPGAGLNADPYTLLNEVAQYTTTQTSTVLVAGGASERIIVTSIQIQAAATTAATLQVYFGTGAYARGTDEAIFDGEFAPSATLKPGFVSSPPSGYRAGALGDDILVTTSAGMTVTINVWYYVLGV